MRLDQVAKRYGRRHPWVVHDVDLSLEAGSLTVLSGTNGSGKSTLLRIICGLSRPTRGAVRGRPARVAVMPDHFVAPARMTGRAYLLHLGRIRGLTGSAPAKRAAELAETLAIAPGLDTPMQALSKGNAQKIGLAQVFLAPADLLVLDEPYTALDSWAAAVLDALLDAARADGAAVVLSDPGERPAVASATRYAIASAHIRPVRTDPQARRHRPRALVRLGPAAPGRLLEPLTGLPGVTLEPTGQDGTVTLSVEREAVDRLLLLALRGGWSVREVRTPGSASSPAEG